MKKFRVCFIAIDTSDRVRYFNEIVEAENAKVALKSAKRKALVSRRDLVRDVHISEVV